MSAPRYQGEASARGLAAALLGLRLAKLVDPGRTFLGPVAQRPASGLGMDVRLVREGLA